MFRAAGGTDAPPAVRRAGGERARRLPAQNRFMRMIVSGLLLALAPAVPAGAGTAGEKPRPALHGPDMSAPASPALLQRKAGRERCRTKPDPDGTFSEAHLACLGEPFGRLVRELQEADPVTDAQREADEGDFRLITLSGVIGRWTGEPGVGCVFRVPRSLIRAYQFFGDVISRGEPEYKRALYGYSERYNATLVEHPDFPHRDLCKAGPGSAKLSVAYKALAALPRRSPKAARAVSLHIAARNGDSRAVRALLKKGADPDKIDEWGFTPLGWALATGHEEIAARLLAAGADPDRHARSRPAPLNIAVFTGSRFALQLLLKAGADVNRHSPGHSSRVFRSTGNEPPEGTPLRAAVLLGRAEMVHTLLAAGADPNMHEEPELSPLVGAVSQKRAHLLALLLKHGADARLRDRAGLAVIQLAAAARYADGVRLLAAADGLADARSAAERALWQAALEQDRALILMDLVAFGAHAHLLTVPERARLAGLIKNNQRRDIRPLLEEAAARAARMEDAIKGGNLDRVREFYRNGAEIAEGRLRTGIAMAVEAGRPDIVAWYLEQGADPLAPIHHGNLNWLNVASEKDGEKPKIPITADRRIHRYGPYPVLSPLTLAFRHGPPKSARLLAEKAGPAALRRLPPGGAPLDLAVTGFRLHRDPKLIDLALSLGPALPKTGPQADRLLRDICKWTGDAGTEVLKTFLDRGYRPRRRGEFPAPPPKKKDGPLPESLAFNECIRAGPDQARLLLKHGADPDQLSPVGWPPLFAAAFNMNHTQGRAVWLTFLKDLLNAGADPNKPGTRGTALDRVRSALRYSKEDLKSALLEAERLLLRHGAKTRAQLEAGDPPAPRKTDLIPPQWKEPIPIR